MHRYYGESIPFGSAEKAFKDATTLGYLNSAQALADYAEILIHVKEEFEAQKSPIIVIGLSYGGMLASWFRLKYPHIAVGALASSAPILFFEDITPQNAFALVVSNDFKGVSENCYDTIKRSWSIIDEIASAQHGLRLLSTRFKTCKDLKDSSELKKYLEAIYTIAAQSSRSLVQKICQIIDQAPTDDSILDKIMAVVVAIAGDAPCYVIPPESAPDQSDKAWEWQKCTEIVMPGGRGDETMFQRAPFNQNDYNSLCMLLFAIRPRTHWITTYYGGRDIKLTLKRFASNIIFSNGLRDPYSSGGVLEDISETILAVTAEQVLTSWFRLKYPHIALGALAPSAPVLYFEDITPQNAFDLVVFNDFKKVMMQPCYVNPPESAPDQSDNAWEWQNNLLSMISIDTMGNQSHLSRLKKPSKTQPHLDIYTFRVHGA
ncbi:hypothetical protein HS088_TW11G00276 [Tripterygium wilfordii]|uniref:Lysosomal Pro-X carboxypeptidase n=1 Tax=Tripterygium wilfordii TaxID=458696 RepID=A0A7J7D1K6_TRIWF|nr:hypothetical protein HS088_TW11G00276 [Tripterygium wilfordii]